MPIIRARAALLFIAFHLAGAIAGTWLANAMFDLSVLQFNSRVSGGWEQWLGEVVATVGLILTVLRAPPGKAAGLLGCWAGGLLHRRGLLVHVQYFIGQPGCGHRPHIV